MNFSVQMQELLDSYCEEIQNIVKEEAKSVANETAKKLKAVKFKTSEKGYSKGWTSKKVNGAYVVYNKDKPGLTHLLENGHIAKNQYGEYGRVPAVKHIEPVEEEANEEFVRRVEDRL